MEASDEDEEYSQFRLKKDQDQANEGFGNTGCGVFMEGLQS